MKKKIIIGILIAALVAGGSAGGAVYYKKSHQKTVSVVSVDSLAGQYYMDDTNLNGNIVTSATQSVNIDKDMIIKEVYVSKGDSVKKGDQLMSFDMTLVQMELNIAKLKQKQQEQDLNKAINRLSSLKNGGKKKVMGRHWILPAAHRMIQIQAVRWMTVMKLLRRVEV